jgi:hypothetical protein
VTVPRDASEDDNDSEEKSNEHEEDEEDKSDGEVIATENFATVSQVLSNDGKIYQRDELEKKYFRHGTSFT